MELHGRRGPLQLSGPGLGIAVVSGGLASVAGLASTAPGAHRRRHFKGLGEARGSDRRLGPGAVVVVVVVVLLVFLPGPLLLQFLCFLGRCFGCSSSSF
jgi:hypothetical protein